MQTIQNTLYVTLPQAYVHLENDTIRIDVEREKKLQVPLHHLSAVVCVGTSILVSPALMGRLAEEGKSLVFLDDNGRFRARLEGPVTGNILLRRAQHACAGNASFTLETARAIVAGKIKNSRQVLMRAAREADGATAAVDRSALEGGAEALGESIGGLRRAADLDQLRGVEGDAAHRYFQCFNQLIRPPMRERFVFGGRTRRPPRDRVNALLSFLYAVLMNDCRSALETAGLDPQLGFLHAVRPGRAALALDLMEEFRAYSADRLALTLINRNQLDVKDFEEREGGAVSLTPDGRRTVIVAYQERKREETTHPLLEQKHALSMLPFIQARLLARTIRGEVEGYVPFIAR